MKLYLQTFLKFKAEQFNGLNLQLVEYYFWSADACTAHK